MAINFTKMQAAGNDFVVIDNMDLSIELNKAEMQLICDRHFGVGADGLILVEPAKETYSVAFMNYFNSDGSVSEMCGNGSRSFALYLHEHHLVDQTLKNFNISTRAGQKNVLVSTFGQLFVSTINMGLPQVDSLNERIHVERHRIQINRINMGNPHSVIFVDSKSNHFLSSILKNDSWIQSLGRSIEESDYFPDGVNIEFVEKINTNVFRARVWERGVGETQACGTGACAIAVAADASGVGSLDRSILLDMPGGHLIVTRNADGTVNLSGPACTVYTGQIEQDKFSAIAQVVL